MNKLDYLKQLESALSGKITADELDDIIRDYAEYFEEGKKQGKTEDEISLKLGIPFEVAQQILSDEKEIKEEKKTSFFNNRFFSGASAPFKKNLSPPKPPKEEIPKASRPPRPPRPPRQRREMGCLGAFLMILAILALLPLAFIGIVCLGSIFLAVIVAGISLGIAGICAWIAISVCSAFLPPIAVAAGVVIGLAMISVCVTVLTGILWGTVSLCKAIGRLISGRQEPPMPPAADNFAFGGGEPYQEETPADTVEYQEVKEEGDDQTC